MRCQQKPNVFAAQGASHGGSELFVGRIAACRHEQLGASGHGLDLLLSEFFSLQKYIIWVDHIGSLFSDAFIEVHGSQSNSNGFPSC